MDKSTDTEKTQSVEKKPEQKAKKTRKIGTNNIGRNAKLREEWKLKLFEDYWKEVSVKTVSQATGLSELATESLFADIKKSIELVRIPKPLKATKITFSRSQFKKILKTAGYTQFADAGWYHPKYGLVPGALVTGAKLKLTIQKNPYDYKFMYSIAEGECYISRYVVQQMQQVEGVAGVEVLDNSAGDDMVDITILLKENKSISQVCDYIDDPSVTPLSLSAKVGRMKRCLSKDTSDIEKRLADFGTAQIKEQYLFNSGFFLVHGYGYASVQHGFISFDKIKDDEIIPREAPEETEPDLSATGLLLVSSEDALNFLPEFLDRGIHHNVLFAINAQLCVTLANMLKEEQGLVPQTEESVAQADEVVGKVIGKIVQKIMDTKEPVSMNTKLEAAGKALSLGRSITTFFGGK